MTARTWPCAEHRRSPAPSFGRQRSSILPSSPSSSRPGDEPRSRARRVRVRRVVRVRSAECRPRGSWELCRAALRSAGVWSLEGMYVVRRQRRDRDGHCSGTRGGVAASETVPATRWPWLVRTHGHRLSVSRAFEGCVERARVRSWGMQRTAACELGEKLDPRSRRLLRATFEVLPPSARGGTQCALRKRTTDGAESAAQCRSWRSE